MIVPWQSEIQQWLAGVMLALSFVMLAARRPSSVVGAYAAQAVVLALASGWQAWLQASPQLAAAGLVTLGAKGIGLPLLLRPALRSTRLAAGGWPRIVPGAVLVVLAIAAAPEDLAPALAITLLGLLAIATRHDSGLRAIGLLSLENGVILAAVGALGLPMVLALVVASLGVAGFVAARLVPARTRPA